MNESQHVPSLSQKPFCFFVCACVSCASGVGKTKKLRGFAAAPAGYCCSSSGCNCSRPAACTSRPELSTGQPRPADGLRGIHQSPGRPFDRLVWLKIEGFHWFRWVRCIPGKPSYSSKRTPMHPCLGEWRLGTSLLQIHSQRACPCMGVGDHRCQVHPKADSGLEGQGLATVWSAMIVGELSTSNWAPCWVCVGSLEIV